MPRKTKSQKIASAKRRIKKITSSSSSFEFPIVDKSASHSPPNDESSNYDSIDRRSILGAADYALRTSFPNDYHRRCYYAAATISHYLKTIDVASYITGGPGLFPATSLSRGGWDGYADDKNGVDPHQWAATRNNPIIDVMTIYDIYRIQGGRGFDQRPAIWWDGKIMPYYLMGYQEKSRGNPDTCFGDNETRDNFRRVKEAFYDGMAKRIIIPNPIISSPDDIEGLARKGYPWAKRVIQYADHLYESILVLRRSF